MIINTSEFNHIIRFIETKKRQIQNEIFYAYPYFRFDEGHEIANNELINNLYKILDDSITEKEIHSFKKIYRKKIHK